MSEERLSPERSARLLRAKAAELEEAAKHRLAQADGEDGEEMAWGYVMADIALIATLLADHIERTIR